MRLAVRREHLFQLQHDMSAHQAPHTDASERFLRSRNLLISTAKLERTRKKNKIEL